LIAPKAVLLLGGALELVINMNNIYIPKEKIVWSIENAQFGNEVVSNSEGNIFVTNINNNLQDLNAGAVIIYDKSLKNRWSLNQVILGKGENNYFGSSIDLNENGNILVIGSLNNEDSNNFAGDVSIYTGFAAISWNLKQKITGKNIEAQFGKHVAISDNGSLIAVGEPYNSGSAINAGAVYLYTGDINNGWSLKQKIDGINIYQNLGNNIITNYDGSIIVVNSITGDTNSLIFTGSHLIFTGNILDGWTLKQNILGYQYPASSLEKNIAIDKNGDTIIIGESNFNNDNGAVFIYTGNTNLGWTLHDNLTGHNKNGSFGRSLSINYSGDLILVGEPNYVDRNGFSVGSVLLYSKNLNNQWSFLKDYQEDSLENLFGYSVNLSSNNSSFFVGAPYDNEIQLNGGAIYAYTNKACREDFFSTDSTKISLYNQNLKLMEINDSWISNSGSFEKYGYTNIFDSDASAGNILSLKNDTSYFFRSRSDGSEFASGLFSGLSGFSVYLVNYGADNGYDPFSFLNRTKQQLTIKQFRYDNTGYKATFAFDQSWATFDLSGLMNSNNAFSWAVNIVEDMRISGIFYEESLTGNNNLLSLYIQTYSEPTLSKELVNYFESFQTVCEFKQGCDEDQKDSPEKIKVYCWTGTNVESKDFRDWLALSLSENVDALAKSALESRSQLESVGVELYFTTLSGYILYNTWLTGEQIIWNLYNFDYTGTYKIWHLDNIPPYPSTGFSLTYPYDWNSIDSLVSGLNQRLNSPVSYPVWYPYPCLSGQFSGLFVEGPLMYFWKNTGTTGDGLPPSHVNNRIDFRSLRNLPQITIKNEFLTRTAEIYKEAGMVQSLKDLDTGKAIASTEAILDTSYKFDFVIFDKPRGPEGYQGFKYLLPQNIILEGLNRSTNLWETLDTINIYEDYTKILDQEKIFIDILNFFSGVLDFNQIDSYNATGVTATFDLLDLIQEPPCEYRQLFQFSQIVQTPSKNVYCSPTEQVTNISFVWPENCPTFIISGGQVLNVDNVYWCNAERRPSLKEKICPEPIEITCPDGYTRILIPEQELQPEECPYYTCIAPNEKESQTPIPVQIKILRTGSNFSLNAGFNDPENGNYDLIEPLCNENLLFTSYKEFKVRLIDFFIPVERPSVPVQTPAGTAEFLLPLYPLNNFWIHNINFYDALNIPINPMSGESECIIGADYMIDVSGLTPLRFTGFYDVNATLDMSGRYTFQNVKVGRPIIDSERSIKFNKVSGYIYEESGFAFLNNSIDLSGQACYTFDNTQNFFYNPDTSIVTFSKTLCADMFRTGVISGEEIVIKASVINKELLVGGRYNTPVDFYTYTQDSLVAGTLKNTPYRAYNVSGIYNISGTATGIAKNGFLEVNLPEVIRPY
jgi:hypothetical protein